MADHSFFSLVSPNRYEFFGNIGQSFLVTFSVVRIHRCPSLKLGDIQCYQSCYLTHRWCEKIWVAVSLPEKIKEQDFIEVKIIESVSIINYVCLYLPREKVISLGEADKQISENCFSFLKKILNLNDTSKRNCKHFWL